MSADDSPALLAIPLAAALTDWIKILSAEHHSRKETRKKQQTVEKSSSSAWTLSISARISRIA